MNKNLATCILSHSGLSFPSHTCAAPQSYQRCDNSPAKNRTHQQYQSPRYLYRSNTITTSLHIYECHTFRMIRSLYTALIKPNHFLYSANSITEAMHFQQRGIKQLITVRMCVSKSFNACMQSKSHLYTDTRCSPVSVPPSPFHHTQNQHFSSPLQEKYHEV